MESELAIALEDTEHGRPRAGEVANLGGEVVLENVGGAHDRNRLRLVLVSNDDTHVARLLNLLIVLDDTHFDRLDAECGELFVDGRLLAHHLTKDVPFDVFLLRSVFFGFHRLRIDDLEADFSAREHAVFFKKVGHIT